MDGKSGEMTCPCIYKLQPCLTSSAYDSSAPIGCYWIGNIRKFKDKMTYFFSVLNPQVQPDLEELTTNMEDNEGTEAKEEVNLGKLQFSMDYDFQKSEVRLSVFSKTTQPSTLSGTEMSTGKNAVTLCGWGVKTGMVHFNCGFRAGGR